MAHPRYYVEYYLGIEKAPIFAKWAWNKDFDKITTNELCEKWNELHGDKLKLNLNSNLSEDISKMIDLWKKENED